MPLDRQLVVATSSNAVSDLSSDRCLALHAEQLHKQRLVEREKHHHKQLWTKDSHGGPYRKVWASSTLQYTTTVDT